MIEHVGGDDDLVMCSLEGRLQTAGSPQHVPDAYWAAMEAMDTVRDRHRWCEPTARPYALMLGGLDDGLYCVWVTCWPNCLDKELGELGTAEVVGFVHPGAWDLPADPDITAIAATDPDLIREAARKVRAGGRR